MYHMIIFIILQILLITNQILSETIETSNGRIFENVKIESELNNVIEFSDKDGILIRIRKEKVISIRPDKTEKEDPPEATADSSLPLPMPQLPPKVSSLPENTILLTQSLANDGAFQGSSLYGERDARRNNLKYSNFYQAYYLSSNIDFISLPKSLKFSITLLNPLVDRTNTDNDLFYQTQSGGPDKTDLVMKSFNSGYLQYDPNSVKQRNEQNKLLDYLFSRMVYEHYTRLGTFYSGFLFINANEPSYFMRGYFLMGWKLPFLNYLNPNFSINSKVTSEYAGIYQGNHNFRLSLSHEFFKGQKFRVIPSIFIGYQDVNNNLDKKRGFSDISPRLQFEYQNFFIALNYMYRSDKALVDNPYSIPDIGYYSNLSQTDGKTVNPSKVYGYKNQYIINTLSSIAPNDYIKQELIMHYQEQKIVNGIFFINIGYSLRI